MGRLSRSEAHVDQAFFTSSRVASGPRRVEEHNRWRYSACTDSIGDVMPSPCLKPRCYRNMYGRVARCIRSVAKLIPYNKADPQSAPIC